MTSQASKTTAAPMIYATQPMLQPIGAIAGKSVEASRALAGIAGLALFPTPEVRRFSPTKTGSSEPADGFLSKSNGDSAQTCALVMLFLLFCAVLMSGSALHAPTSPFSHGLSILVEP